MEISYATNGKAINADKFFTRLFVLYKEIDDLDRKYYENHLSKEMLESSPIYTEYKKMFDYYKNKSIQFLLNHPDFKQFKDASSNDKEAEKYASTFIDELCYFYSLGELSMNDVINAMITALFLSLTEVFRLIRGI